MKVIFQDIDGVLYPCVGRKGYLPQHQKEVRRHMKKDPYYKDTKESTIMSAYGWNHDAMKLLKQLVEESGAMIVMSTSWRFMYSLQEFKEMFHLYGLEHVVIDLTPRQNAFRKEDAIQQYLTTHPKITAYVVLDDTPMESYFPNHCVTCPDVFDTSCYQKAKHILSQFD